MTIEKLFKKIEELSPLCDYYVAHVYAIKEKDKKETARAESSGDNWGQTFEIFCREHKNWTKRRIKDFYFASDNQLKIFVEEDDDEKTRKEKWHKS